MDDVIVPSCTVEDNFRKLKILFEVAQKNGLLINFDKCKFVQTSINFLGHIISAGTIKPSLDKTKAIKNFPIPTNIKHVQSFLGLAGYFRKFIENFAIYAKPLSDLIRKDTKFEFGIRQKESFVQLKEKLCNEPVVNMYNPSFETELHTDASSIGYGGCLLQKHPLDGKMHPVFFLSFKTSEAESKLASFELEVLAIVKCLEKLRIYLLGIKFKIYTDCKAFYYTMKTKNLNSKVARWALLLEEYNCEVIHRSGSSLRHVDALSRNPEIMIMETGILQNIRNMQDKEERFKTIKDLVKKNGNYNNYVLRSDILYKFIDGKYLLVVPKSIQNEIIRNVHEMDI